LNGVPQKEIFWLHYGGRVFAAIRGTWIPGCFGQKKSTWKLNERKRKRKCSAVAIDKCNTLQRVGAGVSEPK
jgi:hypothetical protein